jgi:uncharacterized protein YutE (UPF0331/DUF86 family)
LTRLPTEVRTRLRDIPRHLRALQSLLASTNEEPYAAAARSTDPDVLTRDVYPLERAFEILGNYVVELAKSGVEAIGAGPKDAVRDLQTLAAEGATTPSRAARLIEVHRTRNNLAHRYPDIRGRMIFEAAGILETELGPFLRDYTRWMIAQLPDESR